MKYIPTLEHALADLNMDPRLKDSPNYLMHRETHASILRHSFEVMIISNDTSKANATVDELFVKHIRCDPSDVFYKSFLYGKLDIIKIFERYQALSDENIKHGLTLAAGASGHNQIEVIQYALEKAQQLWGAAAKDHIKAADLILKTIDGSMWSPQKVHKTVQLFIPFNTSDLSDAVIRASAHQYKKTARLLLKHANPQIVFEKIDNHDHPNMQWLIEVLNQQQRTTIKKTLKTPTANSRRKM